MSSARNHGALSTVNSVLKPWSSTAVLGMCSQQMPLILFWLQPPGVSGLRFTLGNKGQLCFRSREGSQAAPGLGQGVQHPGTGSRGRGQKQELLKPASPFANMPADGDEHQGLFPSQDPDRPPVWSRDVRGRGSVWGGLQTGQMASLRNKPQYLLHLQRKWIWVTQDQDKPLGLCREMGLWGLGTATADQQVLGR